MAVGYKWCRLQRETIKQNLTRSSKRHWTQYHIHRAAGKKEDAASIFLLLIRWTSDAGATRNGSNIKLLLLDGMRLILNAALE